MNAQRDPLVRVGPHLCCITDSDGRIIIRNVPTVTVTTRKFDAPRLVAAITDYVEYRSFTCTDLKEYADELTRHIKKAEELRAVIGDITALELGRRLKSIEGENFDGYYVKHERRETEGVVWRIYLANVDVGCPLHRVYRRLGDVWR